MLIARAAGGRAVPRWFHEGLALTAERAWDFGDRARFVYQVARRGVTPIGRLDALFDGGEGTVMLAYSIAGAFVQDLLVEHGPGWPARLLAAMRHGASFDQAFQATTGTTVAAASDVFWRQRRLVAVWLPWVTSPATMWSVITLLAHRGHRADPRAAGRAAAAVGARGRCMRFTPAPSTSRPS